MLLTCAVIYVLLALTVMAFQRRLIYLPTQLAPSLAESAAAREGFRPWRNRADEIIGWHLPAMAPATGAVLVVHGNAGAAFDRAYLAQPIHDAVPLDVYLLEYPGYGGRSGSPSQSTILAAADDAFETLAGRRPLYIVSESLGAGVAAHLARRHPSEVAGLALIAPYDNLLSVAQRQMPFLPVGLLLWDRYNPSQWLNDYRGPLKVVLAEADTIIPARFGQRLYDRYLGPKSLRVVPGADHNDIAAQPPEWWAEVVEFWEQHRPQ